jgi:hypothetical protein
MLYYWWKIKTQTGRSFMFQNMKLGTKMFIGFAVVLCCSAGRLFRFQRVDRCRGQGGEAGDVSQMEKWLLEARRQEKNFILRGDSYLAQVKDNVQKILDQAATTKTSFKQKANQDRWTGIQGGPVVF